MTFCIRYIGEAARPVPKKSDILVRVHAAGLNRADTLQRKGKYPAPKGESEIMGLEVYVVFNCQELAFELIFELI